MSNELGTKAIGPDDPLEVGPNVLYLWELQAKHDELKTDLAALVRYHKAYVLLQNLNIKDARLGDTSPVLANKICDALDKCEEAEAALSDRVKAMLNEEGE
jgi:hypothetical protein